jgi:2OG-Fe(II) oxygenase superfamily
VKTTSTVDVAVPCKKKIMLRMTCGPTNTCIDFHCDASAGIHDTTSSTTLTTTQIPLNASEDEYQGGNLVLFVNQQLHVIPRPPGSLVQHQSRALHGVTSVTGGTRKSLFVLEQQEQAGSNRKGGGSSSRCSSPLLDDDDDSDDQEEGVVQITSRHVDSFLLSMEAYGKEELGL